MKMTDKFPLTYRIQYAICSKPAGTLFKASDIVTELSIKKCHTQSVVACLRWMNGI